MVFHELSYIGAHILHMAHATCRMAIFRAQHSAPGSIVPEGKGSCNGPHFNGLRKFCQSHM